MSPGPHGRGHHSTGTNVSIDFVETAQVWIHPFDENTLKSYLATEESLGKAGAYSIQGEGAQLIEKIEGDYPTIVGLPLWRTAKVLEKQGVVLPQSSRRNLPLEAVRELEGFFKRLSAERGFAPANEILLFRQKDPKPFPPVPGPAGSLRRTTEFGGCATRYAQTVLPLFPNSAIRLGHAQSGHTSSNIRQTQ